MRWVTLFIFTHNIVNLMLNKDPRRDAIIVVLCVVWVNIFIANVYKQFYI